MTMPPEAPDPADFCCKYLEDLQQVLAKISVEEVTKVMGILGEVVCTNRRVFLAGNGGSAATASHMANDFMKTIAKTCDKSIRAIALSDNVPLLTAIGNDESFAEVFAGQLEMLAHKGDILIVISGSGNSQNLVRAVEVAKELGVVTVGFLGMNGGKLRGEVDASIIVPSDDYGPIEDCHLILNHLITAYLQRL